MLQNITQQFEFFHGLMRATEGLLVAAEIAATGVNDQLKAYYYKHLAEESRHADWLAEDLKTQGIEPPAIHWQAAALAGLQYYLINHVSPWALLGYMAVLEGQPMEMKHLEQMEESYGKELFRTYRYHQEHDPGHLADIVRMSELAPKVDQEIIAQNARQTALYINGLFAHGMFGVVNERLG